MAAVDEQAFASATARWQAVSQRNPAAHSSFVYGVKTTKIYCRPTCTARIARRANITYFSTREAAEGEGFRPCRKCKPEDAWFWGQREEIVFSAINTIYLHKNDSAKRYNLQELARSIGVTPSYLCRVFKKVMGCTLGEYVRQFESDHENLDTDTAALSTNVAVTQSSAMLETSDSRPVADARRSSSPTVGSLSTQVSSGRNSDKPADDDVDFDSWLCAGIAFSDIVDTPWDLQLTTEDAD